MFTAYISSLLGYGIWNTLLVRYPVSRVTPFALLVPVAGLLAAWIAQGEIPTPIEAVGGGLLLAGVAITTLRNRTQPASHGAEGRTYTRQRDSSMPATASRSASFSESLGHPGTSSAHVLRGTARVTADDLNASEKQRADVP
jgi:hypothetical protein